MIILNVIALLFSALSLGINYERKNYQAVMGWLTACCWIISDGINYLK